MKRGVQDYCCEQGIITTYLVLRLLVRSGFHNIYRAAAMFGVNSNRYCNFAYSALASFRMGMSGSASFHNARKSL